MLQLYSYNWWGIPIYIFTSVICLSIRDVFQFCQIIIIASVSFNFWKSNQIAHTTAIFSALGEAVFTRPRPRPKRGEAAENQAEAKPGFQMTSKRTHLRAKNWPKTSKRLRSNVLVRQMIRIYVHCHNALSCSKCIIHYFILNTAINNSS